MNKIQGLQNWCQYQLDEYPNVSINNFTTSWRNGLAFNALIHKFKPDLINYHELDSDNIYYNNYIAFKAAELHLGIPALLDPRDMAMVECPERLSVITYVSQFHNCLREMRPEGGYHINRFENTNNDNSDMKKLSSRASVNRLARVKCSICGGKVYLLERYVADDKLYHRKCYRTIQIDNIATESDIIGDYLNIYGELKPSMNKSIFVHPLQGPISTSNNVQIETRDPVNVLEDPQSETDESESLSESLSSYEYSENASNSNSDIERYASNQEINFKVEANEILNQNETNKSEVLDEEYKNQLKLSLKDHEIIEIEKEDSKFDETNINQSGEIQDVEDIIDNKTEEIPDAPMQPYCQENMVPNITYFKSDKPIKQRLYVKKRDKELPYSTFFEISYDEIVQMRSSDVTDASTSELSKPHISDTVSPKLKDSNKQSLSTEVSCKTENVKKLIEITPEPEFDSDVSSIEEDEYDSVKPKITRNSIWRKPIISSVVTKKHKSACVPIEGKFKDYAEFKDRLEELNRKQFDIETKARKIQQKLWEEKSDSPLYETLLGKWLDLVEDKDKIFYEENALYSWVKDLKLQEMKLKLEAQIRLLSAENLDDPYTKQKEKELIDKLIETVNRRSELVDAMHEENLRRMDIINLRSQALDNNYAVNIQETDSKFKQSKLLKNTKKFWKRKTSHF